jgi:enterochelin esterase-like enzyme
MHDGQMLFDSTATWNKQEWKVDEWASKLMTQNKVKDFIVVAPHNRSEIRKSDYFPQKPFESLPKKTQDSLFVVSKKDHLTMDTINSDNYLKFLVKELKPIIDSDFSVLTDKDNTVIMGSSMGGLISMYAISEYPEVFGAAACLSTHWIGTYTNKNNPIPSAFFNYLKTNLPDFKTNQLYFDYGTETLDEKYLIYQDKVSDILEEKGFHTNLKFEGADHSENSWNQRLDQPLIFLLEKH